MDLLYGYRELGFIIYALCKAFLPLPSLEVLLIPLCVDAPQSYLQFAVEGAVGTWIGGTIGYGMAKRSKEKIISHLLSRKQIERWEMLMKKYGVFAVFIGGITPIPDFILPYLAGFSNMNYIAFSLTDSFSRFLRSWLIGYSIAQAADIIDFQVYGNLLCLLVLIGGILRWVKGRYFIANE